MDRRRTRVWKKTVASQVLVGVFALVGCSDRAVVRPRDKAVEANAVRLVFPQSVEASDPAVNQVVHEAMKACLENDYAHLRSLWSATEQPLTRGHFTRQWQPVWKITIRKVQPMKGIDDAGLLYYVHAGFEFVDAGRQPNREVVFLIVRQSNDWRIARAPKSLTKQVLESEHSDT